MEKGTKLSFSGPQWLGLWDRTEYFEIVHNVDF